MIRKKNQINWNVNIAKSVCLKLTIFFLFATTCIIILQLAQNQSPSVHVQTVHMEPFDLTISIFTVNHASEWRTTTYTPNSWWKIDVDGCSCNEKYKSELKSILDIILLCKITDTNSKSKEKKEGNREINNYFRTKYLQLFLHELRNVALVKLSIWWCFCVFELFWKRR